MNKEEENYVNEQRDGLVDLVEFLMKIDKKYDTELNTEMIVLDKDGNEVKL